MAGVDGLPPASAGGVIWKYRMVWMPVAALLLVLVVTWLLVPKQNAPFIYEFF